MTQSYEGTYWKAFYDNGTMFDSNYDDIDRSRLQRFDVYASRFAVYPSLSVDIPKGTRLVHRRRTNPTHGWQFTMVAIESEDRSLVDLYVINDTTVHHQKGYTGAYLWPPDLVASEM